MNPQVSHYVRLGGLILLLTLIVSVLVLVIGWLAGLRTATQFSNTFFVTGAILIILGLLSVAGGFMQRANFNIVYSQSAGDAPLVGRTKQMMADIQQGYGMLILLEASGVLFVAISILIGQLFIQ